MERLERITAKILLACINTMTFLMPRAIEVQSFQ